MRVPIVGAGRALRLYLPGFLTVLMLLVVWEAAARWRVYNPYLFPPPSKIAEAFSLMVRSGEWFADLWASFARFALGSLLGNVLGLISGVVTGRAQFVRNCLNPVFNFLRAIPSVALIPIAILWLGIGETQKVFLVAWGVFFPVWLNTHVGVAKVEDEYVWAARSLGARGWRLYKEVYVPRALPFIVAGTRIGIATGFFALASAEMAGAFSGVAFRAFHSHQMFMTDKMMVAIMTIGALGVSTDWAFVRVMRFMLPWSAGDERVSN